MNGRQTSLRIGPVLRDAIDAHLDAMRREHPGACIKTSDAMRDLMERGLRTLQGRAKKAG